jgi:hypothetical protein
VEDSGGIANLDRHLLSEDGEGGSGSLTSASNLSIKAGLTRKFVLPKLLSASPKSTIP